jgi:hypothetical protein
MTIGADNFAFGDLSLYSHERSTVQNQMRDFAILVHQVVEVQHYGVRLSAINARMSAEVLQGVLTRAMKTGSLRIARLP